MVARSSRTYSRASRRDRPGRRDPPAAALAARIAAELLELRGPRPWNQATRVNPYAASERLLRCGHYAEVGMDSPGHPEREPRRDLLRPACFIAALKLSCEFESLLHNLSIRVVAIVMEVLMQWLVIQE